MRRGEYAFWLCDNSRAYLTVEFFVNLICEVRPFFVKKTAHGAISLGKQIVEQAERSSEIGLTAGIVFLFLRGGNFSGFNCNLIFHIRFNSLTFYVPPRSWK